MNDYFSEKDLEIIKKHNNISRSDLQTSLPLSNTPWKCVYGLPSQRFAVFSNGVHYFYAKLKLPKEFQNKIYRREDLVDYSVKNSEEFYSPANIEECTKWYDTAEAETNFISYYSGPKNNYKKYILKVTYKKHVVKNGVVELEPTTIFIDENLVPCSTIEQLAQFNALYERIGRMEEYYNVKKETVKYNPNEFSSILRLISEDESKIYENALYDKILKEFDSEVSNIPDYLIYTKRALKELEAKENSTDVDKFKIKSYKNEILACEDLFKRYYLERGRKILILSQILDYANPNFSKNNGNEPGER